MKKVWAVWLQYPNEHKRLSALFRKREEAQKYAETGQPHEFYKCLVTSEPVHDLAEDV